MVWCQVLGHLVARDVPLDGTLSWTGLLVGGAAQLALAVLFGALFRGVAPTPSSCGLSTMCCCGR